MAKQRRRQNTVKEKKITLYKTAFTQLDNLKYLQHEIKISIPVEIF